MKRLAWLVLAVLFAGSVPLPAKPKVDVRIKVNEYYGDRRPRGNLAATLGNDATFDIVYYMNVTVLSDDAAAVAKNNGQWCLTGDLMLDPGVEYHGTLQGGTITIELPEKSGKAFKKNFLIFDHKWRTLSNL